LSSIVYPIVTYNKNWSTLHGIFMISPLVYYIDRIVGYNIGGINASGQVNHNNIGIIFQILNGVEGPFPWKSWSHRLGHPEGGIYKEITSRRVGHDYCVF